MPSKILQVLERFRGEFSVKRYGAVGNGVADDTAAIRAAYSAAKTYVNANASGATVFFPPGKYLVSDTVGPNEDLIHTEGSGASANAFGPYGSSLIPTPDFPNDQYVWAADLTGKTQILNGNNLTGLSIRKDATLSNTVHGVHWRIASGVMSNCRVIGMSGRGMGIQGYDTNWKTIYSIFDKCRFRLNGTNGVELLGSTSDMFFTNCLFDGQTTGSGLHNPGAGTLYQDCHFTGNLNNIKFFEGATEVKISGCMFETPREHNIFIDATDGAVSALRIIGNRFDSNALTADNTFDTINISRSSGSHTVGCIIALNSFSGSGANKPRYHINMSGAVASGIEIARNTYSVAGTASINHHSGAVRCLVNGLGRNVGDPTTTGNWFGNGKDSVSVLDTSTDDIYLFSQLSAAGAGAWRRIYDAP